MFSEYCLLSSFSLSLQYLSLSLYGISVHIDSVSEVHIRGPGRRGVAGALLTLLTCLHLVNSQGTRGANLLK